MISKIISYFCGLNANKDGANIVRKSEYPKLFANYFTHLRTSRAIMNINQRLEEVIKTLFQGNKRAFARTIGVAPTVIENVVGARQGKPSFDVLEKICSNANISADWLLTGRGEMLSSSVATVPAQVKKEFKLRTDRTVESQAVPLYDLNAAAGLVALFEAKHTQEPTDYLQIPDLPPCDGAVYVRGDSMYPLLKSGDIVLYKEVQHIFWGEMYLLSFSLDGEEYITIKYIQKGDREDTVRLVSHNPHHAPKDIPIDSIRALALVKASVRFNTMG